MKLDKLKPLFFLLLFAITVFCMSIVSHSLGWFWGIIIFSAGIIASGFIAVIYIAVTIVKLVLNRKQNEA